MRMNLAACQGMDTEIFFPEVKEEERAAKRICSGCMIRSDCLALARELGERHGIWGGMTPGERRK